MSFIAKLLQGKKSRYSNVNASAAVKMYICWNNLFFLGNGFNTCHVWNSAIKSCVSAGLVRQCNAFGKLFSF